MMLMFDGLPATILDSTQDVMLSGPLPYEEEVLKDYTEANITEQPLMIYVTYDSTTHKSLDYSQLKAEAESIIDGVLSEISDSHEQSLALQRIIKSNQESIQAWLKHR